MAYMCAHMKRTVVYNQGRISIALTRHGECPSYYYAQAEMLGHSCTATEESGKLLMHPRFAAVK